MTLAARAMLVRYPARRLVDWTTHGAVGYAAGDPSLFGRAVQQLGYDPVCIHGKVCRTLSKDVAIYGEEHVVLAFAAILLASRAVLVREHEAAPAID
eukprot:CAMPEP_0183818004 /NCGR_PEP_ID=MMETSP0803_2-20130417/61462_1 /TAXON_ID=195967 /ORGANISM="Crustomastix stigmata, Strain CCMP3273" /LENGTH=96 /DNA_ID=CAMNT_0026062889 /DNA_START=142 /DNA_END=431 /DNA_ORIENTATION=+